MLNPEDIQFLVQLLDNGKYEGIKSCLKVNEVFLKLQELANEHARTEQLKARDNVIEQYLRDITEEVVEESDDVVEPDNDCCRSERPFTPVATGDSSPDVCDVVCDSRTTERSTEDADNGAD